VPIGFDPRQSEWNIAQRGVPFRLVEDFEWGSALVVEDTRRVCGERRFQALGLIMGRLHAFSIRLPPDTLARWKATGPGWQTRMADALDKAIRKNAA
jgi:uncharacterized DUF497 family protein